MRRIGVIVANDEDLTEARLNLMLATLQVLRNCLNLLGVEAPERM
jgi:arginyl-tRNA synthetase